jgi:hypothetical protein
MKEQTRQQMETAVVEMRYLTEIFLSAPPRPWPSLAEEYPTEVEKILNLIKRCLDSVKDDCPGVYRLIQEEVCRQEIIKSIRNP